MAYKWKKRTRRLLTAWKELKLSVLVAVVGRESFKYTPRKQKQNTKVWDYVYDDEQQFQELHWWQEDFGTVICAVLIYSERDNNICQSAWSVPHVHVPVGYVHSELSYKMQFFSIFFPEINCVEISSLKFECRPAELPWVFI